MAAQDELFQLIKSLTPSEKRYFKVNGESKSNYMQLFDAMDAQKEEYDEQKLKKKHAKKAFIKYLSAEKKQLREHIMKWMRAYSADSTIDNKINDLLQDDAFYRAKGLNELRKKALAKAKEFALKYERFHLLREVLMRQTGFKLEFEKKQLTEPILNLLAEQKEVSKNQQNELILQTKNRELFSLLRSSADMDNVETAARVEKVVTELESFESIIGDSFFLQCHYNRAKSNYFHLHRNWKSSFLHTKNEYELYERHSHFKKQDASNYKACLANLMSRGLLANEKSWFQTALDQMKALPVNSLNEAGEVFQNVYFQEHLFYINEGDFEKAEALVPVIEKGLKTYQLKINVARKIAFRFNIMIMYFLMHNFKEALKWTEFAMSDTSKIKQGQRFVTTLLLPIIHFELGHADLVETYTRSAYRYLQSKNHLHEFELLVVNFLKEMPLSLDQPSFLAKLSEFNSNLENLLNDPTVRTGVGMEELSLWSKSHLTGVPMHHQLKDSATSS